MVRVLCLLALALLASQADPLGPAAILASQTASEPSSPRLREVLQEMDQAALRFRTIIADLDYTKVTLIVNDHSTEKGKLYFEKAGKKLRMMLAFQEPSEKYVLFSDSTVSIYRPRIAEVEQYSLGKNQGLIEQFLLLGFGTSGTELQKSYQVAWAGEETLDGAATVRLTLTPLSPEVSSRLRSIDLWLSRQSWQPVQQKFTEPSGDYLLARYSNMQLNARIASKNFQLPLRGKVRTTRPQGM